MKLQESRSCRTFAVEVSLEVDRKAFEVAQQAGDEQSDVDGNRSSFECVYTPALRTARERSVVTCDVRPGLLRALRSGFEIRNLIFFQGT